jgi:F-type H+-transporting ATPase subunit epsilon
MAKLMNMHVDIVSAEESIFSGRAQMVVARGTMGDLGITAGHAPLLTLLLPGPVRILTPTDEEILVFVSGGILEVQPDITTILADTVVRAADLNEAEIIKAKQLAQEAIAQNKSDFDYGLAQAELVRAAGMLRALQSLRKNARKK